MHSTFYNSSLISYWASKLKFACFQLQLFCPRYIACQKIRSVFRVLRIYTFAKTLNNTIHPQPSFFWCCVIEYVTNSGVPPAIFLLPFIITTSLYGSHFSTRHRQNGEKYFLKMNSHSYSPTFLFDNLKKVYKYVVC